jgi:hypothetical protein
VRNIPFPGAKSKRQFIFFLFFCLSGAVDALLPGAGGDGSWKVWKFESLKVPSGGKGEGEGTLNLNLNLNLNSQTFKLSNRCI